MSEPLTIRIAGPQSDALRAAAAARGEAVDALVGVLVADFLAARDAPDLRAVMARLREREAHLRARGVAGLLVFGSVARGDARAGSDVDLLADFAAGAGPSLVGLASLRADLADALGVPADLVDRAALRPDVLAEAEQEAVRVW